MKEIKLDDFLSDDCKVFSSRIRGTIIRKELKLEEIDETDEKVLIIISDNVYCLTSGFILALFGDSMRKFGKEGFLNKYTFQCHDIFMRSIIENIEYAIRPFSQLF